MNETIETLINWFIEHPFAHPPELPDALLTLSDSVEDLWDESEASKHLIEVLLMAYSSHKWLLQAKRRGDPGVIRMPVDKLHALLNTLRIKVALEALRRGAVIEIAPSEWSKPFASIQEDAAVGAIPGPNWRKGYPRSCFTGRLREVAVADRLSADDGGDQRGHSLN